MARRGLSRACRQACEEGDAAIVADLRCAKPEGCDHVSLGGSFAGAELTGKLSFGESKQGGPAALVACDEHNRAIAADRYPRVTRDLGTTTLYSRRGVEKLLDPASRAIH